MNIQELGQKLQSYPALIKALKAAVALGFTGNETEDSAALLAMKTLAMEALSQAGEL